MFIKRYTFYDTEFSVKCQTVFDLRFSVTGNKRLLLNEDLFNQQLITDNQYQA